MDHDTNANNATKTNFFYTNIIKDISMGSVFLAAKVEECPIRFLDLVNVFDHLIKKFHRLPLDPMPAYQQVSKQIRIWTRQPASLQRRIYAIFSLPMACIFISESLINLLCSHFE